ncbi:importin-13 isoform X2 [Bacillus rossius redtenbacheri]|uniref:importin-13 isoform X2 n=1 Tax=Bacillus rossius redtenbacheri TaxID=93214 RepID=UPI002FDD9C4B
MPMAFTVENVEMAFTAQNLEMAFTAGNVEQVVTQFYVADQTTQANIHQWLVDAQMSPEAWLFVWELLQPNKAPEVQFFAATTLHAKVVKSWHEIPVDQYESLKRQILQSILNYCMGPKIVLNKLCIALTAYVFQTLTTHWPSAIPELLATFQPSNLVDLPPARTVWILLQILTVLPEEFQKSQLPQNHKNVVRNELQKNIPFVLPLVESVLATNTSGDELSFDVTKQTLSCASAWFQLGVPLPDCERLADHLISSVFRALSLPPHQSSSLVDSALDALSNMVTHPDSHRYPRSCMQMLSKLLPLQQIIQLKTDRDDQEMRGSIYSLFISFAENHCRLLLDTVLIEGEAKSNVLQLVHLILDCSNSPGAYPTEENTSQLAFGYWYILQDDIIGSEPEQHTQYLSLFAPVYCRLAEVLLHKSVLPDNDDAWTCEEKEAFRCYRQDAADTMLYCYNILLEQLLRLLLGKLEEALEQHQADGRRWQPLESCLHAFFSVAESVPVGEARHLPRLLATLQRLPFQRLDMRVVSTCLDVIGAYAEWINAHPEVLNCVIPLLVMGLGTPQVAPAATMSLKDLTRDCQSSMAPFAHVILQAVQVSLRGNRLKVNECVRLMYTVGRLLSVRPMEEIMNYLNQMLMPYVEELLALTTLEANGVVKAGILLRLKMLGNLFSSLDVKAPRGGSESEGDQSGQPASSGGETQPVLLVLQRVLPVFRAVVDRWGEDEQVLEAVCSGLKNAVSTLLDDSLPLLSDMTHMLVKAYHSRPHTAVLDLARQLIVMFGKDKTQAALMESLLQEICSVTLQKTSPPACVNLSEQTDILEYFFNLLAQLLKKIPDFFALTSGIDRGKVFQCSILALSVPEAPTVKASASFLVNFISQSREMPSLFSVVQSCGEVLTRRILRNIGGESPRSVLEHLADVLLALNKKHGDSLSRWLHGSLLTDAVPLPRASPQQKEQFVKNVLKERANKRKLQETVKEFSLVCRGLIGTEYGAQSSPFF